MSSVAGVILAGGYSKRMGREKALLPLPGMPQTTFVEHLTRLLAAHCREVVLVMRDAEQVRNFVHCSLGQVSVVTDAIPDKGPLMGLYSGLRAIQASHALVIAVDMPFVDPAMVEFLLAQPLNEALIVPIVNDIPQVLLAVYPRKLLPVLEGCLQAGRRDLRSLLDVAQVDYISEVQLRRVDPQLRSFVNVNTPEELAPYSDA